MLFLIALALVLAFAVFANALLRITSRAIYLLSLFLLALADIVLTGEAAGLAQQIHPASFLLIHAILLVGAVAGWLAASRPGLFPPALRQLRIGARAIQASIRCHPQLAVLLFLLALVYLANAVLVVAVPPNNVDSMTYHLARVGYWIQRGSFIPWATANPRQTTSPMNAEIAILWSMLFLRSDRLAGFVQWFAALASAISIYGMARLLKYTRSQSVFAFALWATFPQVILQSTTTQNDLIAGALFSAGVFLLFAGLAQKTLRWLLLSALAMGLAFGTKITILMALPAFAAGVLILFFFTSEKASRPLLIRWGVLCTLSVLLLGAYTYAQNFAFYRNPWSNEANTTGPHVIQASLPERVTQNTLIYLYQAADLSGLPPSMVDPLQRVKAGLVARLARKLHVTGLPALSETRWTMGSVLSFPFAVHEDISWYGILSFILFLPLVFWQGWRAAKTRNGMALVLLLALAGFWIVLCAGLTWTPYKSRYLLPLVTLCAPLLACLYPRGPADRSLALSILVAVAAVILLNTLVQNQSKPLAGQGAIWCQSRLQLQTKNRLEMLPIAEMVDRYVPQNARLALKTGLEGWDYLFFGPRLERAIFQVDPNAPVLDVQDLRNKKVEYLLVEPSQRVFLSLPAGLYWVDQSAGWILLTLDAAKSRPERQDDQLLSGAQDSTGLLSIDPALSSRVGAIDLRPGAWTIEEYEGKPLLWLGESAGYGLGIYLLSDRPRAIHLLLDVEPGPSRADPERTLRLGNLTVPPYSYQERQVVGPGQVAFSIQLKQGANQLFLSAQDAATIFQLPNGDTRSLIVRVNHISVLP